MLTDKQVKKELEKIVAKACKAIEISLDSYSVKLMGRIKRYPSMKSGYYVFVQNFKSIGSAKKSKTEKFFRYTFRCIQFNSGAPLLYEVEKWTPICGSVDDGKIIYRSDSNNCDGMFQERMQTAMNMVHLKL